VPNPVRRCASTGKELELFANGLGTFFYALMAVAFLAVLVGSPGSGFFFLLGRSHRARRAHGDRRIRRRRGRDARLDLRRL